jgi:hypothetical protein
MQAIISRGRLAAVLAASAAAIAPTTARADDTPTCSSSTGDAYSMTAGALTGPSKTDVTLTVKAAPGCKPATSVKHLQIKTFTADGALDAVRNVHDQDAADGIVEIQLPRVERGLRIEADAEVQTGTSPRTYVVRDATTSLLRPDLVVREVRAPKSTLNTSPIVVTAVIEEVNGDVGTTAHATLAGTLGYLGDPVDVTVAAGKSTVVTFAALTLADPVPTQLSVDVNGAVPAEYDSANGARAATVDVTKNELPAPANVLFPSLVGYGAQFNNHLYAPITSSKIPPGEYPDVEAKVKALEPELVRIFYNDNWEENQDGTHPEWRDNYASFVRVVQLAQQTGATIDIGYQNLANLFSTTRPPRLIKDMMSRFADAIEDLVKNHGLTNVRWAEVANEPNAGAVSLDQYKALCQALKAELLARGLGDQVHIMGGGLLENAGNPPRDHYAWATWIAANMGDLVDAYAEHVYWQYNDSGRFEYRLRDIYNLMTTVLPPEQQKPVYMMEYGIRGDATCGTKPKFTNLYYGADQTNCPEIWRTNIAGFQQLWFDVDAAQLGVAGTSKWDAYWAVYDRNSLNQQVYWMTGPASENFALTPTYHAMSLLFHTTVPGWQIIQVDPWQDDDWKLQDSEYRREGHSADDQPEQELVAYAGPTGELTVVGLDTHGKDLNTASTDPPSSYSIGGLPPSTTFNLALWNATGDGTDSVAGTVTTNDVGVARFEVPLQAAFALTTVPVS